MVGGGSNINGGVNMEISRPEERYVYNLKRLLFVENIEVGMVWRGGGGGGKQRMRLGEEGGGW